MPGSKPGRVGELRLTHIAEQREAVGSAVDDFVLYDEVLETASCSECGRPAHQPIVSERDRHNRTLAQIGDELPAW